MSDIKENMCSIKKCSLSSGVPVRHQKCRRVKKQKQFTLLVNGVTYKQK